MPNIRPIVLLLTFALALLLARGVKIRIANADTHDEQGARRAVNVMVLVGFGNNINVHQAKVATTDDS